MMKRRLLKSFLLAAALLVGTNVWGQALVGSQDNTTSWWSAFSDYFTIEPNRSVTVTFKNYSDKAQNHDNYIAVLCSDADRGADGYSEYVVLRADVYAWQGEKNTNTDQTWFTSRSNSFNWDTFKDDMDGADVSITVTRTGASTRLYVDITTSTGKKLYQQMTLPCGDGTQNIRLFLTTENGHLTNVEKSEWEQLVEYDFETQASFTTDWPTANGGNGQESIWGSRLLEGGVTTSHYFMTRDFGGKGRVTTHTISNTSFSNAAIWKIEFDFAMYGSSTNNNYLQLNGASGALFKFTGAKDWNNTESTITNSSSTQIGTFDCDPYASSNRGSQSADGTTSVTKWYHATVVGNPTGVFLTVDKSDGTSVLASTKVSDFANPTTITMSAGKTFGQVAIDDVKFFKMINPVITTKFELSDGTTLIDEVETEVIAGNSFTPTYPASFQSGTKQYTYTSGGDQIASVTADQTVIIVYDESDMPAGTFYAETYEKNGGTTGWSTSTGGRYTPAILSDGTNKYLSVKQNETYNNGATVTGTAWSGSVDKSTDFTMSFDLVIDAATQGTSPLTFFDKDNSKAMLKLQATANDGQTWKINDNADQTVELTRNVWYRLTYSRKGSLTYLTITKVSDASSVLAQTQIATLSDDGGLGEVTFGTDRYYANIALDNVLIRAWQTGDTPEVTETTYTIKYQDGSGNTLKADVVNPTTVGTEDIVATTGEMASFFNDGHTKKYIYVSGNTPITAVADAASNVITLVFREAATWSYTVTNNLGTQVASSSNFEGETIYVPYSAYELKNGVLYSKGTTGSEYRYTFTLTEDNQEETITGYTASNVGGVVAFTEGEDITDAVEYTGGNTVTRASNALAATRGDADRTIFTGITPGKYQIYLAYFKPTSAAISSTFGIDGQEIVISVTDGTNVVTAHSEEFTVSETSDLTWTAGNAPLDWIYIKCTSVPVEVTSAGYATYVNNDYDLDFSETSIEAYKVKVSTKGKATLTKVDNVPVGTPVLLYKDGGATEAIPVMTGAAAVTDNDLVAGTGATVATTDGDYTNMILNNGSEGIGFYFANGQIVASNRAYLHFDSSLEPDAEARMSMVFGDEGTTAISGIKNSELSIDNSVYNLNGQKVMQPTKGLYIVNGKKVIVK